MKEQLSHILDQSVCLSRKQMKEYLSGGMLPEELHAAELHISSCPLCSMAMDGFQEHDEEALAAIASLNSGFLKDHFDNIAPQIHLNSMAPAAALGAETRRKGGTPGWVRPASIAAALLLLCSGAWYLASRNQAAPTVDETVVSTTTSPAVSPSGAGSRANDLAGSPDAAPLTGNSPLPDANPAAAAKAPEHRQQTPGADKQQTTARAAQQVHASPLDQKDPTTGASYYWQPSLSQAEDAALAAKDVKTLPSANDPAKTYQGDIASRRKQMYVPEDESGVAPQGNADVLPKPAATPRALPAVAKPPADVAPPKAKHSDESAEQLYERGEYRSALQKYRQQIRSNDPDVVSNASLQAARCYAALGEPARAEELLRKVIDNGNGRDRRTAKKLLRNLR